MFGGISVPRRHDGVHLVCFICLAACLCASGATRPRSDTGSSCALQAAQLQLKGHSEQLRPPCVTKCLSDRLGQPQTDAERLLLYLTAVGEYCAAMDGNHGRLCHLEPLCQVVLLGNGSIMHQDSDVPWSTTADMWQVMTNQTREVCWPDWLKILNQPCSDSKQDQLMKCFRTPDTGCGVKTQLKTNMSSQECVADALRQAAVGSGGLSCVDRLGSHFLLTKLRYLHRVAQGAGKCPDGCLSVELVQRHMLLKSPPCMPVWQLHELCDDVVRMRISESEMSSGPKLKPLKGSQTASPFTEMRYPVTCSIPFDYDRWSWPARYAADVACDISMHGLGSAAGWAAFQGVCPHRAAVARLLSTVSHVMNGSGCSVADWVQVRSKVDPFILRLRVCGELQSSSLHDGLLQFSPQKMDGMFATNDTYAWSVLTAMSATQAAVMQCASGYHNMHVALTTLWKSVDLFDAFLEDTSKWKHSLLRTSQECSQTCESSQPAKMGQAQESWQVVHDVLNRYCTTALAGGNSSAPTPTQYGVSALGCRPALERLKRNWWRHQLLGALWLAYVVVLLFCLLLGNRLLRLPSLGQWPLAVFSRFVPFVKASSYCAQIALSVAALYYMFISAVRSLLRLTRGYDYMSPSDPTYLYIVSTASSVTYHWLLVAMSAQLGAAVLLVMPSVMSAYGVVDFAVVHFSLRTWVFIFASFVWLIILLAAIVVGTWFILVADVYMILAIYGAPGEKLTGNRLNVKAYTDMRFMCQGLVQALPCALLSTAVIDALLVASGSRVNGFSERSLFNEVQLVLWLLLFISMTRFATEVYNLARLTHDLRASCFVTAVIDVAHHLQPRHAGAAPGAVGVSPYQVPPNQGSHEEVHDAASAGVGLTNQGVVGPRADACAGGIVGPQTHQQAAKAPVVSAPDAAMHQGCGPRPPHHSTLSSVVSQSEITAVRDIEEPGVCAVPPLAEIELATVSSSTFQHQQALPGLRDATRSSAMPAAQSEPANSAAGMAGLAAAQASAGSASAATQDLKPVGGCGSCDCRSSCGIIKNMGHCCCQCGVHHQYPRFTVWYVWVVSVLVGCLMVLMCSDIIWPWAAWAGPWGLWSGRRSDRVRPPYSLLSLWGEWRLSASRRGSLQSLGVCHPDDITCSLSV